MDNNNSILNAFLSQPNTIILFWDKNDIWHILKNNEPLIKAECYVKNGLFDLFSLVNDKYKNTFIKFTNNIKIKKQSKESNNSLESIFMLNVLDNIEMYYKCICYTTDNNEILVKIERLSTEDRYRYDIAQLATNDKMGISYIKEANRLFKLHPNYNYAIIQFDIENFKVFNHQFGEDLGNNLLTFIIDSLKYICNNDQLYVRLTADVFMVLTPYNDKDDLINFVNILRDSLSNYNDLNYKLVFGINIIKDKTKKLRVYGDGAAIARKSIKKDALKYYAFYEDSMMTDVEDEVWISTNMEYALKNKEFHMYLQPKYNLSTNKIVGAEALVRWIHPEEGIITPNKFISIFESNGFIKKLDYYIWEEACKCLNRWNTEGLELIPISVNVSRKHLKDIEYIDILENLLIKYNIDKKYLELEITETLNEPEVQQKLTLLKRKGFTLLMDDFGSGYSSLNTLKDAVFDVVKIDREFLTNFISSIKGQRIVEHTINMTKDIGMDIVAEGVETEDQATFLHSCGCEVVQGFLFARPMPIEDFDALRKISL